MSLREVTVLFQTGNKFHEQTVSIPAELVSGDLPAREALKLAEVRKHFDVRDEWVASVRISEPYELGGGFL
jgi:hypothetical protein